MKKELDFAKKYVKEAYNKYALNGINYVENKDEFDLVTEIDKNIESFLISKINEIFPEDRILSEETRNSTSFLDRTWTIDPIDGTVNMVHGIKIFGLQLSLFEKDRIIFSYVLLPQFDEEYYAIDGEGCYYNNQRCFVDAEASLEKTVLSFGDFTHKNEYVARKQLITMGYLYPLVAKIRMFGSAATDFSFVACGKTQACIVITKNAWDIMPGLLLCKEAGAILTNLKGEPYQIGDDGLIAACNEHVSKVITDALNKSGF